MIFFDRRSDNDIILYIHGTCHVDRWCHASSLAAHLAAGQQASDGDNHVGILRMANERASERAQLPNGWIAPGKNELAQNGQKIFSSPPEHLTLRDDKASLHRQARSASPVLKQTRGARVGNHSDDKQWDFRALDNTLFASKWPIIASFALR